VSLDTAVVTGEPRAIGAGLARKRPAGSDLPYRILIGAFAVIVAAVMALYFYSIIAGSIPGWQAAGWHFFFGSDWNFSLHKYGALPLIVGTALTTALALLLAVPVSIGAAIAIVFLIPRRARLAVSSVVELLAFVPSIVFGVWGFYTIQPWLQNTVQPWLTNSLFHHNWPFNSDPTGRGLMLGSMVLAVMITPTITAISRDVLAAVPDELIEGGLSIGATRGQVLRRVALPSARTGILGAITLGTARALGETIALFLLLGGLDPAHPFPRGLNSGLATLSTEIVANFGELSGKVPGGILYCLALTLMVIVGLTNLTARLVVRRSLQRLQP
jgi:phosphate transport system permease protein